jgi:exopolyphosphatase / guanosine-5'-triphosphate,3'-diphosphate pyrophosphatase
MLEKLAPAADLNRARCWGLGIRVAQRLSGGTATPLEKSQLVVSDGIIHLNIAPEVSALGGGEAVQRRLRQLATTMGLTSNIGVAVKD